MSWPTQQQQQHQQYHQVLATPPPPPPPPPPPQTPPSRRIHTIVENNRKTEMCRNWDKGICRYGERCAFAHGMGELKYRTLREMQNAGRIPDAAKYRCYPCMTWVATGSCPYASRCVFIHDPRVKGPIEAYLYARGHARSPSSAYPSSDSSFFFPDVPRDPDSYELPADLCLYDLDPSMSRSPHQSDRAVYNLWYSFVSMLEEEDAVPMEISGSLSVEDQERPTGKDRGLNGHIRQISSPSLSALEDTRIPAHGNNVEVDQTLAGTGVTTTTSWPDCGYAPSLRLSSSGSAATSTNETHSRAPESRIPRELVRHLPVFSALRRGIPAAPLTPPSPAPQIGVPLGPLTAVKPRDITKPYREVAIDADRRIRDGEDSPTTPLSIVSPEGPHENLQPAQVRGMTARLSPVDFVLAPPPESVPLADRSYESGCYRGHNSSLDLARMMVAVPDCFSPLSERFLNGRTASKGFVKGETAGLGDTLIGGIHMRRGYAGSRCEHLKHHCVGALRGW
ncbi:unnamed protein product [Ascophyllum nodosum]